MRSYLLLFLIALLTAFTLTPLVRRLALRWGVVDLPDGERRIHKQPTPRLGGLAIFGALLTGLAVLPWLNTLVSHEMSERLARLTPLLIAAAVVFVLGVVDDFLGLNARIKTGVQIIAAAILFSDGFQIGQLSLPFGGVIQLPYWASLGLATLWLIGITNAFNLIDGIDGLATGASAFALFSLFITSLAQGHTEICVISIILVGGLLGFLPYNFNPASIFLGDSGSLFLGFMCAALSLVSAQKSSTIVAVAIPLICFGLPIVEVLLSMTRRLLSGKPIFQSDRRHIHHMLLERGLNQRQVVIVLYAVCGVFSLFGILLLKPQHNYMALIFTILAVGLILGVQHLRYDEFNFLNRDTSRKPRAPLATLLTSEAIQHTISAFRTARTSDQLLFVLGTFCKQADISSATLTLHHPHLINLFHRQAVLPKLHNLADTGWQKQYERTQWQWWHPTLSPASQEQMITAAALNFEASAHLSIPLKSDNGDVYATFAVYCTWPQAQTILPALLSSQTKLTSELVKALDALLSTRPALQLVPSVSPAPPTSDVTSLSVTSVVA